jgi:2-succinyl-5-enolpyruvyl-6-hydroxy-3-cyclohexene-1-carboxylate synthase
LFEDYVRWHVDLPCPTPDIDPAYVLTTVEQALYRTLQQPIGPVHLNCMFREPLAPETGPALPGGYTASLKTWFQTDTPYTRYETSIPHHDPTLIEPLALQLMSVKKGLLVVGKVDTPAQTQSVLKLARMLNWPVLPDITSQLRLGPTLPNTIFYYDQLLGSSDFCKAHAPETVLHLGGTFVSKRLLKFLDKSRPSPYIRVKETPIRQDPMHQVTHHIQSDLESFCTALADHLSPSPPSNWLQAWQSEQARAASRLDRFFETSRELSEPVVARLIAQHIPLNQGLYLGNSMPVRDMDMFSTPQQASITAVANRGASGIDGTIASAAGFATGRGTPVTLLAGDLTLLHDLNSLALLRSRSIILVVINNNGGGIFSFLPIARFESVFEPYFGTPHDLTFESAARMFGLHYVQPTTKTEFVAAYQDACQRGTSVLIEVQTNRDENVALHHHLLEICKV